MLKTKRWGRKGEGGGQANGYEIKESEIEFNIY